MSTTNPRPRRMRICLSVDFDALSGYLGTGHTPENTLSDYSAGLLSANVGVPRLLRLFAKHGISDKVTWFIPGHSIETFPDQAAEIAASGAEIGLHGYSHEGAYAMTPEQEADVLDRCAELVTGLLRDKGRAGEGSGGLQQQQQQQQEKLLKKKKKRPLGYRAPLYQIRESTVDLLQRRGFLYDSSMNAHDSLPYFLPHPFPQETPHVPDYSKPAATWMRPTPLPAQPLPGTADADRAMVEIPASWYTEDMTPMGFYPYTASTNGYIATDVVESMWWDRFEWLWENESFLDEGPGSGYGSMYPLTWHPESSGRAHIVGMVDRFLGRLVQMAQASRGDITFETMASVAESWKERGGP
ncbi:glucose 1-dehydrogenase [Diaporthe helianthi]|uniref:Glucose 1-dehydrogenase n=1 Tax=Diaporthe helianthi TaxID=158607 RepID=A0A2P5I4T4_DIAHE|nr:glucose 1-dehydrogenase [Diaporthe helianthi]